MKKNEIQLPPQKTKQFSLFKPDIQDDIAGMGVLENGIPYLTSTGLAKMCNVEPKALRELAINWHELKEHKRGTIINGILEESDYEFDEIYIPIEISGQNGYAFPDVVCMAILEYYAFHSKQDNKIPQDYYRRLARKSLKEFIYATLDYYPQLSSWKHFHDRISLVSSTVPEGYFSIFNEIASMIVDLIRSDFPVNDKIIPDISVGLSWGSFWRKHHLDEKYGNRKKYEHNYPEYYPQADSNPQEPWAYPDKALAEFRAWFKKDYLTNKYPKYIQKKADSILLSKKTASKLIDLYNNEGN